MKKALIIFAVLVFSMSLMAQQRAGTVYGKIVDAEKNPLPGVTVTLNGPQMAPLTTVTNETGMYRFPQIPPGNEYVIKAELQGFKSIVQPAIVVTIGASTEINLTLEVGKLEEQVTVTAASPVVDPKKTTTAMSVNKEEMQSLPTARDPWVVMQLAPAVMLDRENVGGNESGQQSGFVAKGDMSNNGYFGSDNIWAVDGIDITDPAALARKRAVVAAALARAQAVASPNGSKTDDDRCEPPTSNSSSRHCTGPTRTRPANCSTQARSSFWPRCCSRRRPPTPASIGRRGSCSRGHRRRGRCWRWAKRRCASKSVRSACTAPRPST